MYVYVTLSTVSLCGGGVGGGGVCFFDLLENWAFLCVALFLLFFFGIVKSLTVIA